MLTIKLLDCNHFNQLSNFLYLNQESSLFMLSNLEQGGMIDQGKIYQASYFASINDNQIQGVVSHTWTGMLLLQAPYDAVSIANFIKTHNSRRLITGIAGPWLQVAQIGKVWGLFNWRNSVVSKELIFSLQFNNFIGGKYLLHNFNNNNRITYRKANFEDLNFLVSWQIGFENEIYRKRKKTKSVVLVRQQLEKIIAQEKIRLLFSEDKPLSMITFNAQLSNAVQIGGVYTVPSHRNYGFARTLITMSLLEVYQRGINQVILTTNQDNLTAQSVYQSLGFRQIGEYGFIFFSENCCRD